MKRAVAARIVICLLCVLAISCGEVQRFGTDGVVMQRHEWDCGVAALKMVLDHYGIQTAYDELLRRADTGTRAGTSMLALKQLSESHGLRCAGWRLAACDLRGIPLPAILLLRRGHFVVLSSISAANEVILLDPARGRLRVSLRRLRSLWEGEALLFNSHESIPDSYERWFGTRPLPQFPPP